MRIVPDSPVDITNNVEWNAVEEGFRLLERDLGKLQVDEILLTATLMHTWRPSL